jgi:hypothetical protein
MTKQRESVEKIANRLTAFAGWLRRFFKVAHLVRFSFWASIVGSAALIITSQSEDVLRVIAEDYEHWPRRPIIFNLSALALSLMSWYWARALIYRFAPGTLDLPAWQAEGVAARWLPRICGLIPFVGIGYALSSAAHPLTWNPTNQTEHWLMILFWLNLAEGIIVAVGLYFRRKIARSLGHRFPKVWPAQVKTNIKKPTDLPRLTWIVLAGTLGLALALLILFSTSTGEVRFAGWFGPASLVLIAVASWIAAGSVFFVYLSKRLGLPIFTPLLVLALLFSYCDINDNHEVRTSSQPITAPQDFEQAFQTWWNSRADKESYRDRRYPIFIISAEGGGITTAYFAASVLTAIQDRAPTFAQHVFAISGVSGGSVGTAVYAALARRCTKNLPTDQLAGLRPTSLPHGIGPLQHSADAILQDDYLSPVLAGFFYPDLVQRFLPFRVNRWDRARALEERLERSWERNAPCGETTDGANEMSQSFYDFFHGFPNNTTPALFFNTTNVESGERTVITNLLPPKEDRSNYVRTLADVKPDFNLPFSSAVFLSARFPLVTPAGFIHDGRQKSRFVDGGYYENSGTATALNILMSLKLARESQSPTNQSPAPLYDDLKAKSRQDIMLVIVRIGVPLPDPGRPRVDVGMAGASPESVAQARRSYRGKGLNEILSPIKTLLNTRGARGNDSVRFLQAAVQSLGGRPNSCSTDMSACMFNFDIREDGVKLPLGWILSDKSRCEIQKQVGSMSSTCPTTETDSNQSNKPQLNAIITLLNARP